MKKEWDKILSVTLLKADTEKWGMYPVSRIKESFDFDNPKTFSQVKSFVKDEIKLLEKEITHFKKWSPVVYHKNTYVARENEKRTLKIILERLEKL